MKKVLLAELVLVVVISCAALILTHEREKESLTYETQEIVGKEEGSFVMSNKNRVEVGERILNLYSEGDLYSYDIKDVER